MTAKILDFQTKKEISKKNREPKEKSGFSEMIIKEEEFNKVLTNPELAGDMFPPDYFMLVE
jgi:hypothetical protein